MSRAAKSTSRSVMGRRSRRAGQSMRKVVRRPIRSPHSRAPFCRQAATRGLALAMIVEVLAGALNGARPRARRARGVSILPPIGEAYVFPAPKPHDLTYPDVDEFKPSCGAIPRKV